MVEIESEGKAELLQQQGGMCRAKGRVQARDDRLLAVNRSLQKDSKKGSKHGKGKEKTPFLSVEFHPFLLWTESFTASIFGQI